MNTHGKPHKLAALIVGVAIVAALGGYWFARRDQLADAPTASTNRKVLYWYDPMSPNVHFDKPGKSPFMDMELVPKYSDEVDAASVSIDPTVAQNFGVRIATVERALVSQPIDAVGTISFNQRNTAIVQARSSGFVARVYARAAGDLIEHGAPLVDLVVPEWTAAQTEFIALLNNGDRELIDAARQRLMLLGMPQSVVRRVETQRAAQTAITVGAPIAGVIEAIDVRQGMSVDTGATLAKINGLDTVWIEAAVPESQGGLATLGESVEVHIASYPGEVFEGTVVAVLPEADVETRTLRVRIELKNPDAKLRPGSFARVRLAPDPAEPQLLVASEAVIRTGTRAVVIVTDGEGRFTPTEVQVGAEANGKTIILSGLSEGQKVVASGQFLIDSEANLSGVLARLGARAPEQADHAAHTAEPQAHIAMGTIESIGAGKLVISHEPVDSLGWPAMTMPFKLDRTELAKDVQVGDRVHFTFAKVGSDYVIQKLDQHGGTP
jgi:membrane fusion protein, copper/silver efflux system